jgi:hypothetical protein
MSRTVLEASSRPKHQCLPETLRVLICQGYELLAGQKGCVAKGLLNVWRLEIRVLANDVGNRYSVSDKVEDQRDSDA